MIRIDKRFDGFDLDDIRLNCRLVQFVDRQQPSLNITAAYFPPPG